MAYKKILLKYLTALLFSASAGAHGKVKTMGLKPSMLKKKLEELERSFPDQFGLYIKDLGSGESFSWRGEETWYLASGVKLPVAIEVLRQVDQGKLNLNSRIVLQKEDFVDGAGSTNHHKPGRTLSIRYLIRQMMIYSDNTASDLLINKVGLENIQGLLKSLHLNEFRQLTTLADVRRKTFSYMTPDAEKLQGPDFLFIKKGSTIKDKVERLHKALHHESMTSLVSWNEAFNTYYKEGYNSATLVEYGKLLEVLLKGQILSLDSLQFLLKTMAEAETGKNRIKAGLPKHLIFAHKTGTQYKRVCDFGIAWNPENPKLSPVVISACTRDILSVKKSEKVLKKIGKILTEAGVFDDVTKIVSR